MSAQPVSVMKRLEFSVNAAGILAEIANHFSNNGDSSSPGIVMGCNEIRRGLVRIAQRAIELQDPILLTELQRLGCVKAEAT